MAQISDGLVALPADARTREHLDWLAEEVREGGGTAAVWIATPAARDTERDLAISMAAARAVEYTAILDEATAALTGDLLTRASVLRRLRAELRRVVRRDFFPGAKRDQARAALQHLARSLDPAQAQELEPAPKPPQEHP